MGVTIDIGRRIELVPMDPHFHNITIALYRQRRDEGLAFLVHTYSHLEGAKERIAFLMKAMRILGGMELTADGLLRFPCGSAHEAACKRVFLESCKLSPNAEVEPRPLNILDKKSGLNISVFSRGAGVYEVTAEGEGKNKERRVSAIAKALCKLGRLEELDESSTKVGFRCEYPHDAMAGLLLVRAPNVRTIIREQEAASSRGVLSAPSQQE
jgi:hypothetical protein